MTLAAPRRRMEDRTADGARWWSDRPTLLLQGGVERASRGRCPPIAHMRQQARRKRSRASGLAQSVRLQERRCVGGRAEGRHGDWFVCRSGARRLGGTGLRTRPMTTIRDLLGHGSAWRPALHQRRSRVPIKCAISYLRCNPGEASQQAACWLVILHLALLAYVPIQRSRDEPPGQLFDTPLKRLCRNWPDRLYQGIRWPARGSAQLGAGFGAMYRSNQTEAWTSSAGP